MKHIEPPFRLAAMFGSGLDLFGSGQVGTRQQARSPPSIARGRIPNGVGDESLLDVCVEALALDQEVYLGHSLSILAAQGLRKTW